MEDTNVVNPASEENKPAEENKTDENAPIGKSEREEELERLLIAANQKIKAGEKVLEDQKSENAKLKNANKQQLTVAEELEEMKKEFAAKEAELQRRTNRTAAKEALSSLNITDKDMTDEEFELFVSSDEARTSARCSYFANFVKKREVAAAKAEREKVLKETPTPPGGDGGKEPDDLFLQGFNSNNYNTYKKG